MNRLNWLEFISRQLVETRQSTKAAASILQQVIPDTQIVYVKAPTVSKFRKDFKFLKVREMNDYHHAKDAYLNIVVGNAYFVKFTSNPIHFIKENPGRSYNLKKMFEQERIERNGEIAWEGGNGTIVTVRKFMEKNNILVTRRSYEATGALFDQQIVKKGKVRFRSRAVMNGFVIYRSMEDITKSGSLLCTGRIGGQKGKENTNNRVCADSSEKGNSEVRRKYNSVSGRGKTVKESASAGAGNQNRYSVLCGRILYVGFRKIRGSAIDARCKSAGTFPGRNRNTEKNSTVRGT